MASKPPSRRIDSSDSSQSSIGNYRHDLRTAANAQDHQTGHAHPRVLGVPTAGLDHHRLPGRDDPRHRPKNRSLAAGPPRPRLCRPWARGWPSRTSSSIGRSPLPIPTTAATSSSWSNNTPPRSGPSPTTARPETSSSFSGSLTGSTEGTRRACWAWPFTPSTRKTRQFFVYYSADDNGKRRSVVSRFQMFERQAPSRRPGKRGTDLGLGRRPI